MPLQHPASSTFRVAQWREDVAKAFQASKPANQTSVNNRPRCSRQHSTGPALAEVSANPQRYNLRCHRKAPPCYSYTRKRKCQMDNEDHIPPSDNSSLPRPRGRPPGRPPTNPRKQSDQTMLIPLNDNPEASSKRSTFSSQSGRGRAKSRSGSRTAKTFEQPRSTTNIDLRYLGSCDPPVERRDYEQSQLKYGKFPAPVEELFSALSSIPPAVIPGALKVSLQLF